VPDEQVAFAHRLIDAGVDVVHGHSSHHVKALEVYRDRPILYGCGDLINDYEGISGNQAYRPHLAVMFLVTLDGHTGRLLHLQLVPMHMRRFRLNRPSRGDVRWLFDRLNSECKAFGLELALDLEAQTLEWKPSP
jgi:poly-gamma-glutamate synthesis protein (capsule biosynthesis protein)